MRLGLAPTAIALSIVPPDLRERRPTGNLVPGRETSCSQPDTPARQAKHVSLVGEPRVVTARYSTITTIMMEEMMEVMATDTTDASTPWMLSQAFYPRSWIVASLSSLRFKTPSRTLHRPVRVGSGDAYLLGLDTRHGPMSKMSAAMDVVVKRMSRLSGVNLAPN